MSSAADGIRKSDLGPNSLNYLRTSQADGEVQTVAFEGSVNAREDEKVGEILKEHAQLEEGQSRVTYPRFKPKGNALALALILKNASSSPPPTNREQREGEVSVNEAKTYSISLEEPPNEIIVLAQSRSSKEGYPETKGSCDVDTDKANIPLPPPIPVGREPAKPKSSEELRRGVARTPSPNKSGPLKLKS